MQSIYPRGKRRTLWAQWRGQRWSLQTTDRKIAESRLREFQRRTLDPSYRPTDPSATLANEIAGFIQRQAERGRAPGTLAMYELHGRSLCTVIGGDTPIEQVDAAAIDRYVSVRTNDGASKSYRWKELCTLRGVLKRARKLGRYSRALDVVMPDDIQPDYTPLTRHLLLPDVRRLLKELDSERQRAVAFIVCTGADLGCLVRAEAGDVAGGFARVRGSKTRLRDRVVPLLLLFGSLTALCAPPFRSWPNARRDLIRAAKRAGVAEVTARDLRRSHGRILRTAGVEPSLIAPMLGHAPGSPVTALTYAQISPGELGRLITRGTKKVRPRRKTGKKTGKTKAA